MHSFALALLATTVLAGCGQVQGDPGPSPQAGQLTLVAVPDRLSAGGTVHATVTVAGPDDYEAACVQTVRLWVLDAQERQVWAEPAPEVTCMAIVSRHVPSGETASFGVDWPTAPHAGSWSLLDPWILHVHPASRRQHADQGEPAPGGGDSAIEPGAAISGSAAG